jgi:hypothetical protein
MTIRVGSVSLVEAAAADASKAGIGVDVAMQDLTPVRSLDRAVSQFRV